MHIDQRSNVGLCQKPHVGSLFDVALELSLVSVVSSSVPKEFYIEGLGVPRTPRLAYYVFGKLRTCDQLVDNTS